MRATPLRTQPSAKGDEGRPREEKGENSLLHPDRNERRRDFSLAFLTAGAPGPEWVTASRQALSQPRAGLRSQVTKGLQIQAGPRARAGWAPRLSCSIILFVLMT